MAKRRLQNEITPADEGAYGARQEALEIAYKKIAKILKRPLHRAMKICVKMEMSKKYTYRAIQRVLSDVL